LHFSGLQGMLTVFIFNSIKELYSKFSNNSLKIKAIFIVYIFIYPFDNKNRN